MHQRVSGMIDTLLKTMKLFGVFTIGSLGFAFIINGVTTNPPRLREEWEVILFFVLIAFCCEIWVYKKF